MQPIQINAAQTHSAAAAISRDELRARLGDSSLKIVNVLPREAFDEAHIPGSLSLPIAQIRQEARTMLPDPAQEIVVYCGNFT